MNKSTHFNLQTKRKTQQRKGLFHEGFILLYLKSDCNTNTELQNKLFISTTKFRSQRHWRSTELHMSNK